MSMFYFVYVQKWDFNKLSVCLSATFFLQVGNLAKVVLMWTCLFNSVQYERILHNSVQYEIILLNSVQYENLLNVYINANWTGQFLGYIIEPLQTKPYSIWRPSSDDFLLRARCPSTFSSNVKSNR